MIAYCASFFNVTFCYGFYFRPSAQGGVLLA